MAERARHIKTGRFLAYDCEVDCQEHCAGLCGLSDDQPTPTDRPIAPVTGLSSPSHEAPK